MSKILPRRYGFVPTILALSALALFTGCETSDSGGSTGGRTEQNGSPTLSFRVRHYHYPEANDNAVVLDDLPGTVIVRLNGIPGRFGGRPNEDHLFDTA